MSKIEIECCLSQGLTALRIDSEGAAKIILDTDSTQLAEVLKLMTLKGRTFKVRVNTDDQKETRTGQVKARAASVLRNSRKIAGKNSRVF